MSSAATPPPSPAPSPTAPPPGGARERILDAAVRLFYAHGVRAVGVDAVVAEAGVAKATLYAHFPGKDALAVAYLDRVDAAWRGQLRAAAEAAGPDPADRLVGMFDALRAACRRDGYRGCGFLNAAAEAPAGGPVHARAVRHKAEVRAWVEDLAARAGAPDPAALARTLALVLDGGLAAGALDGDPAAADTAAAAARALVSSALGARPRPAPGGTVPGA